MRKAATRPGLGLPLVLLWIALGACGGGDDPGTSGAQGGGGGAFPVTIEHKLGSAELPSQPKRVVALGEPAADIALALGVTIDLDVASAMRFPSVLSIPFALDALEPGLAAATR